MFFLVGVNGRIDDVPMYRYLMFLARFQDYDLCSQSLYYVAENRTVFRFIELDLHRFSRELSSSVSFDTFS